MEVRCSNCATEYEFDDALVSARGTSVKCTNCGHQFRVHPTTATPTVAEQWVVRDAQKRETTFTSLRDLQQAIVKGQLSPQHQLSHGGQAFRPLEDIYELQTFFNAARQRPPNRPAPRTLLGVGRDGQPPQRSSTPPPRKRATDAPQERVTPVAGMPALQTAAALDPTSVGSGPRSIESSQRPVQRPSPVPPSQTVLEPAHVSRHTTTSPPAQVAPMPWQNLHGLHSDADVEGMRKGAGSRWIVAVVVLGALALIGGTVGREYILGFTSPKTATPKVDERVPALLEQARLALGKGDFESANAELAKASVLGESDPRVATELARLEVTRVELLWGQQRIGMALRAAKAEASQRAPARRKKTEAELAAEALVVAHEASEEKLLAQSFQDRLTKAKAAVAVAVQRAPASTEVVRAQVDVLRLDGQLTQARTMVGALSAQASDPDNAYSLGALDLAEGPSGYPAAIERLRVAARTEEALGRARPLLIYALAQTDPAAASAELDKLATIAPGHRTLPALRALVDLSKAKLAPPEPEPVVKKPAPPPAAAAAPAPTPAPAAPRPAAVDYQKNTLARAGDLHRDGDLDAAEVLYQAVLQRSPGNIPALSGLGDISRQRHATATAAAYYDQILKQDRNHVPTLMARGDMYWESGNRILAVALYRRALSQVGSSDPMGQKALRRIEEFDRDVAAADSKSAAPSESPAPAAEPSEPGEKKDEAAPAEGSPAEPAPPKATAPSPSPSGSSEPGAAGANPNEAAGAPSEAP